MRWLTAVALGLVGFTAAAQAPAAPGPWRAQEALGAPAWLRFGLEHRSRFENLHDDFRQGAGSEDLRGYFTRSFLSAEVGAGRPVAVVAELEDARAWTREGTPLNSGLVDALELLQAHVRLETKGLLVPGDTASAKLGRFTIDLGSRRLIERNEDRNAINGFAGVDLQWTGPARHALRALAVLPVTRLPSDPERLDDNAVVFDQENGDALLWALAATLAPVGPRPQLEAYVVGLHERDVLRVPSANRRLVTPGLRVLRAPADGSVDFQLEGMLQLGTSRASARAADVADLDHRATSLSATLGYRLAAPWKPRLAAHYDWASGDGDPADGRNGRFDPLFGTRRGDFGPTGLFGPFARSNLSAPGVRLEVAPRANVDAMAAYRAAWLASSRDAWTTAGLRDPTGASGSFLGHQVEARVRWHVLPRNLVLELGGARLVRGRFARSAPSARGDGSTFVYSQATVNL